MNVMTGHSPNFESFCVIQLLNYSLSLHSYSINYIICRLNERSLQTVHTSKTSCFQGLPSKDGSVTISSRNLQMLATNMFNILKKSSCSM